ncbi:TIM barrel protein [Luteolibacter flavescens]|uniref:TIM barrel protein n=1 Tax=Luteolibacter flavescens TaxID=1859460 RepID=A0ABT3FS32_9BACT|nr:TIM barrel protein [Luteolibacter flavescens]MCW1886389.1 TIM barrel protein [Luteolibacter flavescens]
MPVRAIACVFLYLLLCLTGRGANPFFAMDPGISGEPEAVAGTLDALGYDGLGGSGHEVSALRGRLEARGLRLWNVYLTLDFPAGEPALTPEIRKLVGDLKGHDSTLWIAVRKVAGGDDVAVAALREIADHASLAGVKVSLYPHAGHWLEMFSDASRIASVVDRGNVGITFNLCHWLKVEGDVDPLPAISREAARLQFVTINGADKGDTKSMGWDRLIQPLGQGTYDTAGFIRRLQDEAKWHGPVGLQAYGVKGDQRENLRRSMSAWRKMNGLLDGKIFTGYQGWFRCEGDGSGNGWHHYAVDGKFEPGHSHIEMWPDVSELGPGERHATAFRYADGSVAEVFSSVHPDTIRRHFRWMREHGIDGAFLQRFATNARDPRSRDPMDRVLSHVRDAAKEEGREWSLMYDLSGLKPEDFPSVIEDWQRLKVGGDPAYLKYRHRPLVTLWGLGFNDRPPALAEWEKLIRFFKGEGLSVMLGVPCYWRTLDRDTIQDAKLHELIALADIVSPWSVGRFGTPQDAEARRGALLEPDLAWCRVRGLDYLPVIFPGFSWQNLEKSRGRDAKFDMIPRLGGRFLWGQATAARQAGSRSLYVAMFDEMDEGTAIFKTTGNPPVGASRFLAEPDVRSDHYLWLTGEIGKMLRGDIAISPGLPKR